MNSTILRLIILHFLLGQLIFAQEQGFKIPDSLKNVGYEELSDKCYQYLRVDKKETAVLYAKTYIAKAKEEKSDIKIAGGFYHLASASEDDLAMRYMDSVITRTKDLENNMFPSVAYLFKGVRYYNKRAFKNALDNYIEANKYARKNYNPYLIFDSNHSIGQLKNRIGNHREALETYREAYQYAYKNLKEKSNGMYLSIVYSLVTSFYGLKEIDSASYYNNLGISESIKNSRWKDYHYFILNHGILESYKKNYRVALDSINKSLKYIEEVEDNPNRVVAYYHLGKIYYEIGVEEKGLYYLKKLDTIFQQQKDILPETRHGYEILINHYKKNNDQKNQLLYIEKLLEVDSVLYSYYRYIQKNVSQHYDTPLLLEEKDNIINGLEKGRKYSYISIIVLTVISLLAIAFWFLNYSKRKIYKKRFEELLGKTDKEKTIEKASEQKDDESIGISEDIVTQILSCLDIFEKKQGYLKSDITISGLAKDCDTNSKYLSKTINFYKKKSFSHYINELRIDYAVEKLQADKILRNYTINAISREVGFNTTEAFSKSFLKKTGIYPSYFIKELGKRETG